jgi:hypothetical protein
MSQVITITKEYFTIDELKEKGMTDLIEKIADKNRYTDVEFLDWYEPISEGFKEDMKAHGVDVSKIYFSGFNSQGDGAIFEVDSLDIIEFLQTNKLLTKFKKYVNEIKKDYAKHWGIPIKKVNINNCSETAKIKHSGHYYHEKSYSLDFYSYYDYQDEFETYLRQFIENKASQLYIDLRDYYDDLTSNDYVIDSLINNDCMFTVDGEAM